MMKYINPAMLILFCAYVFTSCTKVSNSVDPTIFNGTWAGTITCAGMQPLQGTITISMSGNTATVAGETGQGGCTKPCTYTGTLVNDHLVFSTQLNTDACGNSNSFSASVYVYQNTMTETQSISGPQLTTTCSFTGSK